MENEPQRRKSAVSGPHNELVVELGLGLEKNVARYHWTSVTGEQSWAACLPEPAPGSHHWHLGSKLEQEPRSGCSREGRSLDLTLPCQMLCTPGEARTLGKGEGDPGQL